MTKTTIDNSVRFISKSERNKGRDNKSKTKETGSLPRKQNKELSQINGNFYKNVAAGGFATLTKYFLYN